MSSASQNEAITAKLPDKEFDALIKSVPTRLLKAVARLCRAALRWQWRLAISPNRRFYLAAAFFVGLPALVVMAQLQSLITAMHLPGETAYALRDLAFPPGRADAALRTWLDHSQETTAKFAGPVRLTLLFVLVDSFLLVPAYAVIVAAASGLAFRRLLEIGDDDSLVRAYRAMTAGAFALLPLLVLVDLLENTSMGIIVAAEGDVPQPLEWALTAFWIVKYALAALIVIPLLIAAIAIARRARTSGVDVWRTLVVLRVPIAVVVFFGLFMFAGISAQQIDDLIRRWIGPDWKELILTVLLTILLSVVIAFVCWRLLLLQTTSDEALPLRIPFWAGVALVGIGIVLSLAGAGGIGILALGLILIAIAALSYPIRDATADPRPHASVGWAGAPAILASLPLTLLGLATVRAAIFELVYAQNSEYWLLVLIGLALQAAGWGTFALAVRRVPATGPAASEEGAEDAQTQPAGGEAAAEAGVPWTLFAAAAVVVIATIGIWLDPLGAGDLLGTVGALSVFLIALLLLGYFALRLERTWLAPPVFLVLGLRRFPVILIVVLWAVVAARLDPGGYHNIRTIAREGGGPTTLAQAFDRWVSQQPDRPVPLVLVAAEGGGIRAAYWTARALDCTIDADYESCGFVPRGERGDPGAVFAASGVSGGSLGLVAYVAAVREGERGNWPDARLGDDFLSATSAWMLFTDLPNALLKLDYEPDRAAILERAWEEAWDDPSPLQAGLLATSRDPATPLLLLNGTSVQDGCRVSTSALDADVEEPTTAKALRARDCLSMGAFEAGSAANPGEAALAATHDLVDLLCDDQDVRLSTGALLSARFPWVSPAGRVLRCDTEFATYAVDGGYFDTSAGSPVQELWARLEPLVAAHNRSNPSRCIVPVMLQLDNHYKEPRNVGATGRPWEFGVPLFTVRAARDARENGARQAAALLFSGRAAAGVSASVDDTPLVRYAHLFPRAHPGTSAPLGWALSQASMDDLTNQLREKANINELGKIRRWFSPNLSCTAA